MLQAKQPEPVGLVRPAGLGVELRDQLPVPGCVPLLHSLELAVLLCPLEAELPDVGEHPVPRLTGAGFLGDDDRLVDECTHQIEDLAGGQVVGHTDGRLQTPGRIRPLNTDDRAQNLCSSSEQKS